MCSSSNKIKQNIFLVLGKRMIFGKIRFLGHFELGFVTLGFLQDVLSN